MNYRNEENPFCEFTGVNRNASDIKSPIEAFHLFFSDNILDQIIVESNRYHDQVLEDDTNWKPIRRGEILAFLGITIAMGIVKLSEIENYWRKDGICNIPWFSSIMSVKRYKEILRFLHLCDNENQPNQPSNKLYKLGGLQETLSKTFAEVYSPCQELSADEQMVGTKCRFGFIQYMPKKPQKFGCSVTRSGYCLQFQVYTGKTDNIQEKGISYRVVTDLLTIFVNKNHHAYFDNLFTSIPLLEDLAAKDTFCCGTIRADRGKFPDLY